MIANWRMVILLAVLLGLGTKAWAQAEADATGEISTEWRRYALYVKPCGPVTTIHSTTPVPCTCPCHWHCPSAVAPDELDRIALLEQLIERMERIMAEEQRRERR